MPLVVFVVVVVQPTKPTSFARVGVYAMPLFPSLPPLFEAGNAICTSTARNYQSVPLHSRK